MLDLRPPEPAQVVADDPVAAPISASHCGSHWRASAMPGVGQDDARPLARPLGPQPAALDADVALDLGFDHARPSRSR